MPPKELVKFLSRGKAQAVAETNPDAVIIGADTFVVFNEKVLGKPHTPERAREMLRMLSGSSHSIITGFTIIDTQNNKSFSEAVEAKIYFKTLSKDEIDEYIASGEPLDKAGAYAIQGLGGKFVEKTEGEYSGIVGLPIPELLRALEDFGVTI